MSLEITLGPVAEEYLHAKVASGAYADVSAALTDALLLLLQRDEWLDRMLDEAEASPTLSDKDFRASMRQLLAEKTDEAQVD